MAIRVETNRVAVIQLESTVLATIDDRTILPDATSNREQDALTAANRLRRLMGDAEPLSEVLGKPKPAAPRIAAVSRVLYQLSGLASWYGPGFHGNLSASGEVYNQHAMTAAHPSLPFGTQVRVTNLDNGRSVIVRINDRGALLWWTHYRPVNGCRSGDRHGAYGSRSRPC